MKAATDPSITQQLRAGVRFEQILGIRFFNGTAVEAVQKICELGGLLVVPAAPALVNIQYDTAYRCALLASDMAIADSGFMVLLWKFLRRQKITRISGLAYLKQLLVVPQLRAGGAIFLVVPSTTAGEKASAWLGRRGFGLESAHVYAAPRYGADVSDPILTDLLSQARPAHVIIALGGGVQEKLGHHLREYLPYRPAIHCIGAALGFLTGDQKGIPDWADRFYLGWLLRLARDPRLYARRFFVARELPWLILRYGEQLPPLKINLGPGKRTHG